MHEEEAAGLYSPETTDKMAEGVFQVIQKSRDTDKMSGQLFCGLIAQLAMSFSKTQRKRFQRASVTVGCGQESRAPSASGFLVCLLVCCFRFFIKLALGS